MTKGYSGCTQDSKADNVKDLKKIEREFSKQTTPKHEDHGKLARAITTTPKKR